MELTWIEDFLALVRLRNFTRAAAERGTTQPAFSRRLQRLEEWLGCALVDRTARPFALTPEGHEFLSRAKRLRDDIWDSKRALSVLASHYESAARLYTTNTLAIGFLPSWIEKSGIKGYSLVVASVIGCAEALRAGRATMALVPLLDGADERLQGFTTTTVGRDNLSLIADPRRASDVRLTDRTLDGPLLMYTPGTSYGIAIESRLRAHNVRLGAPPLCESASAEALAVQVRTGLGAAWIPSMIAPAGAVRCAVPDLFDCPYDIALLEKPDAAADDEDDATL